MTKIKVNIQKKQHKFQVGQLYSHGGSILQFILLNTKRVCLLNVNTGIVISEIVSVTDQNDIRLEDFDDDYIQRMCKDMVYLEEVNIVAE